jgi:hypothetical protein
MEHIGICKSNQAQQKTIGKESKMRFQDRDAQILQAIQEIGGVIAKRQLKTLFWKDKTPRAMEKRLAKLRSAAYIAWPSKEQRRIYPVPEPVIWLDWKGISCLASRSGIHFDPLKKIKENQMRTLQKDLRTQGLTWLREPRWSQLAHDLITIDIRLRFQHFCNLSDRITLEKWINESTFRSDMDRVQIRYKSRQGKMISRKKGVCPDGMLVLVNEKLKGLQQPYRARFLLEVDMATHDNTSFGLEKSLAGSVYTKSKAYKDRFGNNAGRWIIITTGETRMKNLMEQTREYAKKNADLFLFTIFSKFFSANVLQGRIWSKCGLDQDVTLFEE